MVGNVNVTRYDVGWVAILDGKIVSTTGIGDTGLYPVRSRKVAGTEITGACCNLSTEVEGTDYTAGPELSDDAS